MAEEKYISKIMLVGLGNNVTIVPDEDDNAKEENK